MSPAAFCFRLTELARQANKRIVLPEGTEPRTVRAAAICAERGIARSVLLGDPDEIRRVAAAQEIALPDERGAARSGGRAQPLRRAARRDAQAQGPDRARRGRLLEDNVWLGTVMLAAGRGRRAGVRRGSLDGEHHPPRAADHQDEAGREGRCRRSSSCACPSRWWSTATARSSPTRTPRRWPTSRSRAPTRAARFGITPRVAMISYSTGESGSGSDVDKVREATRIARALRPELVLDGPLQYDAAAIAEVAATKAPNSPVAGTGDGLRLPRPEHRQHHLQGRAAQRPRHQHRPDAPGHAPAGERSVARRAGRGHRLHDRADGDPGGAAQRLTAPKYLIGPAKEGSRCRRSHPIPEG